MNQKELLAKIRTGVFDDTTNNVDNIENLIQSFNVKYLSDLEDNGEVKSDFMASAKSYFEGVAIKETKYRFYQVFNLIVPIQILNDLAEAYSELLVTGTYNYDGNEPIKDLLIHKDEFFIGVSQETENRPAALLVSKYPNIIAYGEQFGNELFIACDHFTENHLLPFLVEGMYDSHIKKLGSFFTPKEPISDFYKHTKNLCKLR